MKEKIIFDTDIGVDIDDALALAYLLAQPGCELLGVTTVCDDVEARARLASAVLEHAGRGDIPVRMGCAENMVVEQIECYAPQARILDKWPHKRCFEGDAIDYMRRTIRANPGEITLIATGPMTNVGMLFKTDPEIPSLLKSLVLMCGRFSSFASPEPKKEMSAFKENRRTRWVYLGFTDMNSIVDPHATAIVYGAKVRRHRSVGLDITRKVRMDADTYRREFNFPVLGPVTDMAEVWFDESDGITFHDPIPAASIFCDDIVKFRKVNAWVETDSELLGGFVYWENSENGSCEVADSISPENFYKHFKEVLSGREPRAPRPEIRANPLP